jgi:hypothetical protein
MPTRAVLVWSQDNTFLMHLNLSKQAFRSKQSIKREGNTIKFFE